MKVNDVVFQNYQGIRRFGVIRQVEIQESGWTYAGVKWIDDGSYERAMSDLSNYRGGEDHVRTSYRTDEITVIDPEREIKALTKCIWWAEQQQKERKP